jgi:hypothetical protein
MASRRRPEPNSSDQICVRCSKPIRPGTGAGLSDNPLHVRCLARETQIESLEWRTRSRESRLQALAARERSEALIDGLRDRQTHCSVCWAPLGDRRGLAVRDGRLVHGECERDEPKPDGSTRR